MPLEKLQTGSMCDFMLCFHGIKQLIYKHKRFIELAECFFCFFFLVGDGGVRIALLDDGHL